ncbi:MAG: sigma-54 dependent transcriptional regulator [Tepidimonas sp.]|uniref:sigma-54-dependent transcriptional regulator n=1 Tax=Tepidimonas sp. TaxID=2002775 RepID=UPI00298F025A|nr:sigma-54 dependent transcriptional regulator [Tepidimonas sp.]MCS6811373.1 sigma-54 dependent transcriptional regulator [Tepidimonas sp.]MDW8335421.1 sigma-54 dependent transcriptional regulator [Tepidimonas sp.]
MATPLFSSETPAWAAGGGGDGRWPEGTILVVDDEPGMRNFLVKTLAPRCRFVAAAESAEEGERWMRTQRFDLVILDVALPGISGVQWLQTLREQGYGGEVILITAFASLDTAIEALRAGASDFILKPFRVPQILNAIRQCHERARLRRENFVLRRHARPSRSDGTPLIGSSAATQRVRAAIERIAPMPSTVLIQGESGTGKELVARALHARSPRASGPFVAVQCGTLAPDALARELFGQARGSHGAHDGLFVYAQGGTLFLDEVADLPLPVQAGLLRVLEELHIRPVGSQQTIPVDVRVIAATNRPLADAVAAGRFREDLYFRLRVVDIELPPLRQRREDIAALVQHFIDTLAPTLGVAPLNVDAEAMALLQRYDWPGNVRELRNWVERSLILGEVNVSALYPPLRERLRPTDDAAPLDLETLQRRHIQAVLDSVGGDKTRAAQLLGVSRRTLERRAAEWAAQDGQSR